LEIGDMQAYAKPFVRNSGIKLHWAL